MSFTSLYLFGRVLSTVALAWKKFRMPFAVVGLCHDGSVVCFLSKLKPGCAKVESGGALTIKSSSLTNEQWDTTNE